MCIFQIYLCISAFISIKFTCKVAVKFLEFDLNICKAILFIQRFFDLTEYLEVVAKIQMQIWIWYWWRQWLMYSFVK